MSPAPPEKHHHQLPAVLFDESYRMSSGDERLLVTRINGVDIAFVVCI
jgi:hypothetical protein